MAKQPADGQGANFGVPPPKTDWQGQPPDAPKKIARTPKSGIRAE
jgi:hypothetical protein